MKTKTNTPKKSSFSPANVRRTTKPSPQEPTSQYAETQPVMLPASRSSRKTRPITIKANFDAGFGNQLFIRGEGAGLSWEKGQPMTCVDGTTWHWIAGGDESITFKILLNDFEWSAGENFQASPGAKMEIAPFFG